MASVMDDLASSTAVQALGAGAGAVLAVSLVLWVWSEGVALAFALGGFSSLAPAAIQGVTLLAAGVLPVVRLLLATLGKLALAAVLLALSFAWVSDDRVWLLVGFLAAAVLHPLALWWFGRLRLR